MFREADDKNNGEDNDDGSSAKNNKGGIFTMSPALLNMNKKARDVELPFGPSLKRALSQAGIIADSLDSPSVHSEHVLLALLLEYHAGSGRVDEAVKEREYAKGAFVVFLRMERMWYFFIKQWDELHTLLFY